MRIISLLPSATEILYALGAGKEIISVSHECNYPPDAKNKQVVTKTNVNSSDSSLTIDYKVSHAQRKGSSIYQVNHELFVSLKPDLVVTQRLCEVCAITPTDIQAAIRDCKPLPKQIALHPHNLKEIFDDIKTVGSAIGKEKEATELVKSLETKIQNIKKLTRNLKNKPKVYCMEWLDPPYNAGHWVPEQVEIAGGIDNLATKGLDSSRILWQKVVEYEPDFLIIMACGFSIKRVRQEAKILLNNPLWPKIKAVKQKKVFVVNGPAYFNSSSPRVVKGVELLTKIIHPNIFTKNFTRNDFQQF